MENSHATLLGPLDGIGSNLVLKKTVPETMATLTNSAHEEASGAGGR